MRARSEIQIGAFSCHSRVPSADTLHRPPRARRPPEQLKHVKHGVLTWAGGGGGGGVRRAVVFAMSGEALWFDREEWGDIIEEHGGCVRQAVSKHIDFLLKGTHVAGKCDGRVEATVKYRRATEVFGMKEGVDVIDHGHLYDIITGKRPLGVRRTPRRAQRQRGSDQPSICSWVSSQPSPVLPQASQSPARR